MTTEQLDAMGRALVDWKRTNAAIRRYIQSGDFDRARQLTVGDGRNSSALAYAAVDSGLVDAITTARTAFRDDINTAQRLLGFAGTASCCCRYSRPWPSWAVSSRIREYR